MPDSSREEIMAEYDAAQKLIKMSRFDDAVRYLKRCFTRCESAGDAASCETLLGELAMCYEKAGRYEESIETLGKLLPIVGRHGPTRESAIIHHNLGFLHEMIKDLPRAEKHFRRSAGIASEAGDLRGQGVSLTMLGQVLIISDRAGDGLEFLLKAINLLRASNAPELETVIEYARAAANRENLTDADELARLRITDRETLRRFLDS